PQAVHTKRASTLAPIRVSTREPMIPAARPTGTIASPPKSAPKPPTADAPTTVAAEPSGETAPDVPLATRLRVRSDTGSRLENRPISDAHESAMPAAIPPMETAYQAG